MPLRQQPQVKELWAAAIGKTAPWNNGRNGPRLPRWQHRN
jgi:hypothetical protein